MDRRENAEETEKTLARLAFVAELPDGELTLRCLIYVQGAGDVRMDFG